MVFEDRRFVGEVLLIRKLPVLPIYLRKSMAAHKLACQWILLQCARLFEDLPKYVDLNKVLYLTNFRLLCLPNIDAALCSLIHSLFWPDT